jgi:glycine oxidase
LPPGNSQTATDAFEQLAGLSSELHPRWAAELHEATGIDTGYRQCGGIHVAGEATAAKLDEDLRYWQSKRIEAKPLAANALTDLEPALSTDEARIAAAYWLPSEAQLRNPWHLRALVAACGKRGVEIRPSEAVVGFGTRDDRVVSVRTAGGTIDAGNVCVTSGTWSAEVLKPLGIELALRPIRGQIVLFRCERPLLTHIINEGSRYLVPREDGRVLAGSTEEDVGFDKRTTTEGVAGLIEFATGLVPALAAAEVERTWAGLRPGTPDGLPYLGRMLRWSNVYIAAGHYRSGLSLSPATAVVMGRLIRGEDPGVDLGLFQPQRNG